MAQCGQCGKKAMMQVEGGHLLCLDCYEKWQNLLLRQNEELARVYNHLLDQAEAVVGLPGIYPRIRTAERTIVNTGPMNFNNISVKDSVVGVINTGQVQQLDVAVDVVRDGGQKELADALQKLSQAVLDAPDLAAAQKNEAIEHLSFLAEQAALPKEKRQSSIGKIVITGLERVVNAAASVSTLWPHLCSLLQGLF